MTVIEPVLDPVLSPEEPNRGATLFVDLEAIGANYRTVRALHSGNTVSAVVKSDAYGLGLESVAGVLEEAGCVAFWVNDLEEARRLRRVAPRASVFTLFGLGSYRPRDFFDAGVIPVLASLDEVERCVAFSQVRAQALSVAVQLDTGLGRLGLTQDDVAWLEKKRDWLDIVDLRCWVTHLAAFDVPDAPSNQVQRGRLVDWVRRLKPAPVSLTASSGLYMEPAWHFDIARVGSALYGIQTSIRQQEGLVPCYRLAAPILRIATLSAGDRVGYRGASLLDRESRIATVAIGYANGLPPALATFGSARIGDHVAPFIGGISMNLAMLDVTDIPADALRPGIDVTVFDRFTPIEPVAEYLGYAPNVLLTQIGGTTRRYYSN